MEKETLRWADLLAVWLIEFVNLRLAIRASGGAVDATVLPLAHDHVVLEDVEQTSHLREDQYTRALHLQLG